MSHTIQNFDTLNSSPQRHDALAIAEAAYAAIDTERIVREALTFDGTNLHIKGRVYDLGAFERVFVIGFGKASCGAITTIEKVLAGKIHGGIAIDVRPGVCEVVQVFEGAHPHPTRHNAEITKKIVELSQTLGEKDLVLVVVSGGGSSLLCYPADECEQGIRLYDELQRAGATIEEMNTVRKHISRIKGGGLAKDLYPATVIGLIFCDIPGEMYENVASGPTYFDRSTMMDAQDVLDRYDLSGYTLNETPKEHHFFERVHNVPLVSNIQALTAMEHVAHELGYHVINAGAANYQEAADLATHMLTLRGHKTAVIAGGEPRLKVVHEGGVGGRCQHTALCALERLVDGDVFLALASDGIDNSPAAGAVIDAGTGERAAKAGLSVHESIEKCNTHIFFEKTGDLLTTGPTESNVSDLFILITR